MMRRQLIAAAVPGVALFAAFMVAILWPRPVVSDDLKFAVGVVSWLQDRGIQVESVTRWTQGPWEDASRAVTMRTSVGLVQAVVFDSERSLERLGVREHVVTDSDVNRWRYRVTGWPGGSHDPEWESSYRWFLFVQNNWLLVTPDPRVDRIVERMTHLPAGT